MSTSSLPRHKGPIVILGDREFVLPPMNMLTRKKDEAGRMAMASGSTQISEEVLLTEVVLETLQRNYPDLTAEVLQGLASFEELVEVYVILKETEAKRMGELGKRMGALMVQGQVVNTPSTTLSPPSSSNSVEAGINASESLTS